jgi:hypothetical protein
MLSISRFAAAFSAGTACKCRAQQFPERTFGTMAFDLTNDRIGSDRETGTKSQIGVVMDVLRELLGARNLRTGGIAERLGVTDRTVMRWFASATVDSVIIERLCGLAGLSFFEVCELAARRVEVRGSTLTVEQEQALVDDALLNYIFTFTLKGWSAAELQTEVAVPEAMFVDALIRLEKNGLIELLPGNEIRLRTTRDIRWRKNGPYSRYMNMFLRWSLNKPDICEEKSFWTFEVLKLSLGSLSVLRRRYKELIEEATALSDRDRRSNDPSRDWSAVVLATRNIAITPLSQWRTQYRPTENSARKQSSR